MEDNNPYKRRYKTKNEQYQEKLKQRSNSQEWLFGNMFGKPGGGAPLRDNKGNIISHLKTINNDNIFKYDPNVFTRGNNNISSQNINNNVQRNLILNPNSYSNNQINSFNSNNQSFSFQDNNSSINLLLQNNKQQNNNSPILLNQKQLPLVYIIPIQNIIPSNQTYPRQINNNNQNYYNTMVSTPLINNRMNIATPSINYTNKSQNILKENINNISKEELKNDYSVDMNNNIDQSKDNLFLSNDNDNNIKLRNEQKLEEWKKDLKKQMEEQKRKKEEAKRKEIEDDKEEERKYQEFLLYKSQQAEENKKIKSKLKKNRNQQSQNQSNIELDKTNNNNNINNDILEKSQPKNEDIPNYEIEEYPYNPNNPLNAYNVTPQMLKEQETLKKYIDNQYDALGDTLAQNIQSEVENLALNLTKKYNTSSNKDDFELQGVNKFNEMTVERNNRRVEHLHDIIEERELLNFIIGRDENVNQTMKYQNYDISKYNNLNSKMPSYFGKNVMSYENESKQLNSKGKFIYGDFSTNKKETENKIGNQNQEIEFKEKENIYDNSYFNNPNNISKKFGKNKNENMISQSLEFSQSLDNKTSFIPLEKKEQKLKGDSTSINIKNDNYGINHKKYMDIIPDTIEDNIIKNLNEIDKLNKNVILYKKEGDMILDNNNDNIKNNNDDLKEIINIDKNNINNENLDIKNDENFNNKIIAKEDDEENKNSSIDIIL